MDRTERPDLDDVAPRKDDVVPERVNLLRARARASVLADGVVAKELEGVGGSGARKLDVLEKNRTTSTNKKNSSLEQHTNLTQRKALRGLGLSKGLSLRVIITFYQALKLTKSKLG